MERRPIPGSTARSPAETRELRRAMGDGFEPVNLSGPGTCTIEATLAGRKAKLEVQVVP